MHKDGAVFRTTASAFQQGTTRTVSLTLAEEAAIALSYGGIPHAVMMGTPQDLEDFAVGFALTDGVVQSCTDIREIVVHAEVDVPRVDLVLAPAAFHHFLAARRRRSLRGHTSCGLCGVEGIDDMPHITHPAARSGSDRIAPQVIRAAVDVLRTAQPLGCATRATHAAVLVDAAGTVRLAREDIGRHNALDKLIGATVRAGIDPAIGACIITSRCSFEMVQKAVAGGISTLVALSAPTALAVRLAETTGLTLIGFASSAEPVVFVESISATE